MKSLVIRLMQEHRLDSREYKKLLEGFNDDILQFANKCAQEVAKQNFGNKIYTRGLIEISNFCKNDCYYCGIRQSNAASVRYRLSREDVLSCCRNGYEIGFRTFVMQGGEDNALNDDWFVDTISAIRSEFPDCAITLSLGEKEEQSYQRFFDAGANRYLLRHETINRRHYNKLHPKSLDYDNRIKCLNALKAIGYQTGTGMMVGSPFQTIDNLVEDIVFIEKFEPQMIGLGPFLSHKATPFANAENGSVSLTLLLISIFRLMFPKALIPSTTALATINSNGRELGVLAGANVVMPNLSPLQQRKKYELYDNKLFSNAESAEYRQSLNARMLNIGYELSNERGDYSSNLKMIS